MDKDKPIKWVTPYDGFSFLSGHDRGSAHNHPTMYAYDFDTIVVVANGIRTEFKLNDIDLAFIAYKEALKSNGYF